jgi:ABC-2 type transport system permease protein
MYATLSTNLYATYVIWSKHMHQFWKSTEQTFGLALQSVIWVVLFGVGMRGVVGEVQGSDYMSFMLPGIIAFSAVSGSIGGGLILLDERLRGIMKEYLVAPIPRISILLGNAASTATKALFQAVLMLIAGMVMGAHLVGNPLGWLAALLLVALFAIGFSGFALAFAAQSKSIMGYHGMIFLFNLPILFASNALYPIDALPTWMRFLVLLNPTTYLVDALRVLAFGAESTLPLLLSALVVTALAACGVWLAYISFQRTVQREG